MLSFPIPLRILFAAHPEPLTPVLRIIHRVIAGFLLKQAGLKRTAADAGAATLQPISRASARSKLLSPLGREAGSEGAAEYRVEGLSVLTGDYLQTHNRLGQRSREAAGVRRFGTIQSSNGCREWGIFTKHRVIDRLRGRRYRCVQSKRASKFPGARQKNVCVPFFPLGPRAGQKLLSLRTVAGRDEKTTTALCADAHGFSLHAGVRCGAHQRKELERLCRYITRPAIANERLKRVENIG